jgi:hypothetical protein
MIEIAKPMLEKNRAALSHADTMISLPRRVFPRLRTVDPDRRVPEIALQARDRFKTRRRRPARVTPPKHSQPLLPRPARDPANALHQALMRWQTAVKADAPVGATSLST